MSSYISATRTNYFHVKDVDDARLKLSLIYGDEFEFWETMDSNGVPVFGFGCYGTIAGASNDGSAGNFDNMLDILQDVVAENDAVIIMEVGNEQLNYVLGRVHVVTSTTIRCMSIDEWAISTARGLLKNQFAQFKLDY